MNTKNKPQAEQPAGEARGVAFNESREREAFESKFVGVQLDTATNGEYMNPYVEHLWEGWRQRALLAAPDAGTDWAARAMEAEVRLAELKAATGLHGLTNEQIDRILEGFDRRVLQAATGAQGNRDE